jgi:drug/metabolite transporter (DMT)-like permease
MSAARLGLLRCALAALLFGVTTPVAVRLADDTSAPILAGLLYLGAAASVLVTRRAPLDQETLRAGARPLAVAVVAGGLLGPLLLVAGLQRTPAATASLLLNTELVATTVLAAVLFHEHVGRRVAVGTGLVVVAGSVLVGGGADLRVGGLLVVAACVCWGIDNCVTAGLDGVAPEHITLLKGVVAGGTNLVLGLAVGGGLPGAGVVVTALVVGALGYGASITLWVRGARDVGAARGQLVFSSAPFVGVVVAWVAFGDPVTGAQLVALGLAAVGVLLTAESGHQHAHEHEPTAHVHEHAHDDGHHDHEHAEPVPAGRRHVHHHVHPRVVHVHPHVPDLHHRHVHG